ncbi:uncharacterized protein VTP21DRAFT_2061 [Calcarisporiella thermophila]|uniref:uncharacterized protein n=1 Tax=Calcarisporiella thermophila TaxID=911321 RepID=UPI00374482B1
MYTPKSIMEPHPHKHYDPSGFSPPHSRTAPPHSLPEYIHIIDSHLSGRQLTAARLALRSAAEAFPNSFDVLLRSHSLAIFDGDWTLAIQTLQQLLEQNPNSHSLHSHMAEITRSVQRQRPSEYFAFFLKLPPMLQELVLTKGAEFFHSKGMLLDACKVFLLFIKAFPMTTPKYGPRAADLIIQCEYESTQALQATNAYRALFGKRRIHLSWPLHPYQPPSSAQTSSTYPSLQAHTDDQSVAVTWSQIRSWIEVMQGYYIARREWAPLFQISLLILEKCGYTVQSPLYPHPEHTDVIQRLLNLMHVGQSQLSRPPAGFQYLALELPILASVFAYEAFLFFDMVMGRYSVTRASQGKGEMSSRPRKGMPVCLVPFYDVGLSWMELERAVRPLEIGIRTYSSNEEYEIESETREEAGEEMEEEKRAKKKSEMELRSLEEFERGKKKRRMSYLGESDISEWSELCGSEGSSREEKRRSSGSSSVMQIGNLINVDDMGEGGKSRGGGGGGGGRGRGNRRGGGHVAELRVGGNHAGGYPGFDPKPEAFRPHGASGIPRRGSEVTGRRWKLPPLLFNAALLTLAEVCLMKDRLQSALAYYRRACSKVTREWERFRQEQQWQQEHPQSIKRSSTSSTFTTSSPVSSSSTETIPSAYTKETTAVSKPPWLLIFPFRLLYSISTCYLKAKWYAEARIELYMLLSAMPHLRIKGRLFVREDEMQLRTMQRSWIRLTPISLNLLAVRCLKYLVAGLMHELTHKRYDDRIAAQLLVLIQYGWPYYKEDMLPRVIGIIRRNGSLVCRGLSRYLFQQEILEILQSLATLQPFTLDIFERSMEHPAALLRKHAQMAARWTSADQMAMLIQFCREKVAESYGAGA